MLHNTENFRFYGKSRDSRQGASFHMMMVREAANIPPTPWQTEILAGI